MMGLEHKTNSLEQPRMQHTATFIFLIVVVMQYYMLITLHSKV